MGERPNGPLSGPGALERARVIAGLTQRDLWFRYLGLGGNLALADVDLCLRGDMSPDDREYTILAAALNESLSEIGLNHPVEFPT
jgi:hypothetical protein